MGFKSGIANVFGSKPSDTLEGHIDPRQVVPEAIAELVQRKSRALGDKIPKPGTPEAVIADRFDKQIEEAWRKHDSQTK